MKDGTGNVCSSEFEVCFSTRKRYLSAAPLRLRLRHTPEVLHPRRIHRALACRSRHLLRKLVAAFARHGDEQRSA